MDLSPAIGGWTWGRTMRSASSSVRLWPRALRRRRVVATEPARRDEPRVLVLSASVGAGHVRAAQALERAFAAHLPSSHVRHEDVLGLTNPVFRRLYGRGYIDLVNRAPGLLGMLYDWTDVRPDHTATGVRLRLLLERANLTRLERLLCDQPWDAVVCTHFLPAELGARLRRRRRLHSRLSVVVTDFDAHGMWVNEPADQYFVAAEEGANALRYWGVSADRIHKTGVPIDPEFASWSGDAASGAQTARSLGLAPDGPPLVVLLAGGFGVGPVEDTFARLRTLQARVLVVCGRNKALLARLSRQAERAGAIGGLPRAVVIGFTQRMPEILAAADLVVSKPGGLTVSECLAVGVPMALMHPIPGQETRNADFLLERGCAIKINGSGSVAPKVGALLSDPQRLAQMRRAARAESKPHAAAAVCERVLRGVGARAV